MDQKEIKLSNKERQKCEIWTRVMGYYRPVENYNLGKKAEYDERKCFKEVSCDTNECISMNETSHTKNVE